MSLKNPVTPLRIDPGTVRLVAQRLNHYAIPGPKFTQTGLNLFKPIPSAALFKAWVYVRLISGIVGSNPAEDMDVCVPCLLYIV